MLQFLPLFVYFGSQRFLTPELIGDALPKPLVGWLPMLLGLLCFVVTSKLQKAQASKATAAIVGTDAPDMEISFRGEERAVMLRALIAESKKPTIVDFYQNF
mmetsp:Transcript_76456/g.151277  ORF Transcript_76456/g.151277 Transcript_76456/m.151277 type:complete len:102 (-) Transcript_76456:552-857(-)